MTISAALDPLHLITLIFHNYSPCIGFQNIIFHFQIPFQRKKLPLHDFSWERQPSYDYSLLILYTQSNQCSFQLCFRKLVFTVA